MSARAFIVLLVAISVGSGCASASDVEARGRLVLAATDPDKLGYCPPELLAKARAEVANARAASQRGEPIAAELHLDAAERYANDAKAKVGTCARDPLSTKDFPSTPNGPNGPAPDGDQDGVPDALDRCLSEREDRDGFVDNDGCPDVDDDGDGLSDVIDRCPRDPEDLDGYEDLDGCPEPGP